MKKCRDGPRCKNILNGCCFDHKSMSYYIGYIKGLKLQENSDEKVLKLLDTYVSIFNSDIRISELFKSGFKDACRGTTEHSTSNYYQFGFLCGKEEQCLEEDIEDTFLFYKQLKKLESLEEFLLGFSEGFEK
jgi:hypothetical protein